MNKRLLVLAALSGVSLWSCDQAGKTSAEGAIVLPPVSRDDTAVLVNGRPISKQSVDMLANEIAQRRGGEGVPKDKIVDELVKREILRQSAEKDQLLKDPSIAARVDNAIRMTLSQVAAESLLKKLTPTEEEIRKEYDQRVGAMKASEYKARHILVEDEKTALDVIKRLGKGEKFDALAKKLSKDPGSKNNGGDLGWFSPDQMVPPFADAVIALKNGETTKAPVKTDFGWHVIQRESSREQEAPSYESVKPQVQSFLQSDKLQKYLDEQKSQAKIETLIKYDAPAAGKPGQPPAGVAPAATGAPAATEVPDDNDESTEAGGPVEVEEETVIEEQVPPEEEVPEDDAQTPEQPE
ncbi:peptidylprolyl isomerase [Methylolobus aquaticus]|nr:peptidylprolyl isomerase [Methylolobus aquaticus]